MWVIRFDYILCDYNLDDGPDGQQVLEEATVRNLIGLHTVFIMITAENSYEMVMGAMEYHPDGYLTKPFTKELLRNRLETLTKRKGKFAPIEEARRQGDPFKAIRICNSMLNTTPAHANDLRKIKTDLLMKAGLYREARQCYEEVISKRPLAWAELGLGKVLYYEKEYQAAIEIFQRLADASKTMLEPHDWLAKTLEKVGQLQEAQQILVQASELSPRAIKRQQALADLSHKNGDKHTEAKALRKTLKLSRHSVYKRPIDYINQAELEFEQGGRSKQKAIITLKEGERTFRGAPIDACKMAIFSSSKLQQIGDTEKSRKVFANAVRHFLKRDSTLPPPVDISLGLANLAFNFNEKESGMQFIKEVINSHHDDVDTLTQIHDLLVEAGHQEEGDLWVAKIKTEITSLNNRGVKLAKEGKFLEAFEIFDHALSKMSTNSTIALNAAQTYIMALQQGVAGPELLPKVEDLIKTIQKLRPGYSKLELIKEHYKKLRIQLMETNE